MIHDVLIYSILEVTWDTASRNNCQYLLDLLPNRSLKFCLWCVLRVLCLWEGNEGDAACLWQQFRTWENTQHLSASLSGWGSVPIICSQTCLHGEEELGAQAGQESVACSSQVSTFDSQDSSDRWAQDECAVTENNFQGRRKDPTPTLSWINVTAHRTNMAKLGKKRNYVNEFERG